MQRVTVICLVVTASLCSSRKSQLDDGDDNGMGTHKCPLDISVLWTADVESPVYSTPIIIPSSVGARKQIVVATLQNTVELLEGDGSVPPSWPIEMEGLTFHASPAMYDVNGDGIQDICVASTDGRIAWLSPGTVEPFLKDYALSAAPRKITRDWHKKRVDESTGVNDGHKNGDQGRRARKAGDRPQLGEGGEGGHPRDPGRRLLLADAENIVEYDEAERDAVLEVKSDGASEMYPDVPPKYFDAGYYAYADALTDYSAWDLGVGQWPEFWAKGGVQGEDEFVMVDAHILGSPVFADVDADGSKEMIVPINFFFDRTYADAQADFRAEEYVSASLACWNFKQNAWMWIIDLEQTTGDGEKPGYVYASPTVADIDGDGRLEVILGTAFGRVHVFDARTSNPRPGFPAEGYGAVKGQVAAADVDGDDDLELVFGDVDALLVCLKADGAELWKSTQPGSITETVMLGDVDGDGTLDVVVGVTTPAGEGQVVAVSAASGVRLPHFPVQLGNRKGISAPILLVDLHENSAGLMGRQGQAAVLDSPRYTKSRRGQATPLGGTGAGLHLLAASQDGHVYVIEGASGCVNKIDLGERVLSMVLADDLKGDGTLDLIVGTMSGEVVALSTNLPFHPLNSWPSPSRGQLNGFVHGNYQGVYFVGPPSKYEHVVGKYFTLTFEIVDRRPESKNGRSYKVSITAGSTTIFTSTYESHGFKEATASLQAPAQTVLRLQMTNAQHQEFEDVVSVGYNTGFYATLKWMLVAPVVLAAMPFWWLGVPGPSRIPLQA